MTTWTLFLQDFNFTITYKPGKSNDNVYCLSRQVWNRNLEEKVEDNFLSEERDVGNHTQTPALVCIIIILCHLLSMHSFTCIIADSFVNALCDWTDFVNSD